MNDKQEIILQHFRDNKSIRTIAQLTGLHRKTVTKYVKEYRSAREELVKSGVAAAEDELINTLVEQPSYTLRKSVKRKVTSAIISRIEELLELNKQKRSCGLRKQQYKKIDIYEDLLSQGHDIGYTSVCNIIRSLSEEHREVYIRQEYKLGEECEFDWCETKLKIGEEYSLYQMALFTTSAGNYRYSRLFDKQDTAAFQEAHAHFFQKVGGVFKRMVYDNMRVAVKKFVGPSIKEPTIGLLKLSMYYLFDFRFCNVRRGNEKGHVERDVEYVRRKVFAKRDEFTSLAEANEYLEKECDKLNEKKPYDADKSSAAILEEERKYLKEALPFFDVSHIEQLKADKYSTVSFLNYRYSVPERYAGKCVTVRIYPSKVKISYNEEKLCEHERLYGKRKWSLNIEHYIETLKRKPGALARSVALKQTAKECQEIYDKYYQTEPKGFIELLEYIKNNGIGIKEVQKAIKELGPIKEGDIITDKVERICEKNKEIKIKSAPRLEINEIEINSQKQLCEVAKLFNIQTESKERTLVEEAVAI